MLKILQKLSSVDWAMIALAGFFDFMGFLMNLVIPVIGGFLATGIELLGYMVMTSWFLLRGIRLLTPKRLTIFGGGIFISFIPILNMLPELTISVVLTLLSEWKKVAAVKIVNTKIHSFPKKQEQTYSDRRAA